MIYPPVTAGPDPYAGSLPRLERVVQEARDGGADVELTGFGQLSEGGAEGDRSVLAEVLLGGLGALVVLALVFGSMLAGVPLLVATVSILGTFLALLGLTYLTDVVFVVQYLVALIGLGVAIDYSLLVVTRWREERAGGLDNDDAVRRAMTHGRTERGVQRRDGGGVPGGAGAGAAAVPAQHRPRRAADPAAQRGHVGDPGPGVAERGRAAADVAAPPGDRGTEPGLGRDRQSRRPAPVAHHRRQHPRADRTGVPDARAGARLAAAVRHHVGLPRLASGHRRRRRRCTGWGAAALSRSWATASGRPPCGRSTGVAAVAAPDDEAWRDGDGQLLQVYLAEDPASAAGKAALERVRTAAGEDDVGGSAAEDADFVSAVYGNAVWVVLAIVVVTFLLLARALRSLWLPVKALVLNVVSIAAAYGVTVLVWQDGIGSDLLFGQEATGVVTTWVPIAAFAFLFGLSMDYEVFILARMREAYDEHGDTDRAVVDGIAHTGRLVTSAALILFLSFVALSTVPSVEVKILATTLALGILLDAVVVRGLLAPALVAALGHLNWTLPAPLRRLLRVGT